MKDAHDRELRATNAHHEQKHAELQRQFEERSSQLSAQVDRAAVFNDAKSREVIERMEKTSGRLEWSELVLFVRVCLGVCLCLCIDSWCEQENKRLQTRLAEVEYEFNRAKAQPVRIGAVLIVF